MVTGFEKIVRYLTDLEIDIRSLARTLVTQSVIYLDLF